MNKPARTPCFELFDKYAVKLYVMKKSKGKNKLITDNL
jgi:hypothetical protein